MKGDWSVEDRVAFGEVLEHIDRYDFGDPGARIVVENLRRMAHYYEANAAVIDVLKTSKNRQELTQRLRNLVVWSLNDYRGFCAEHLYDIWVVSRPLWDSYFSLEFNQPDRLEHVNAALSLLGSIHRTHDIRERQRVEAVWELECRLLRTTQVGCQESLKSVEEKYPPIGFQEQILKQLLALTVYHYGPRDKVAEKLGEVLLDLISRWNEALVVLLWKNEALSTARELLERGLIKRYGRSRVLAGFTN